MSCFGNWCYQSKQTTNQKLIVLIHPKKKKPSLDQPQSCELAWEITVSTVTFYLGYLHYKYSRQETVAITQEVAATACLFTTAFVLGLSTYTSEPSCQVAVRSFEVFCDKMSVDLIV